MLIVRSALPRKRSRLAAPRTRSRISIGVHRVPPSADLSAFWRNAQMDSLRFVYDVCGCLHPWLQFAATVSAARRKKYSLPPDTFRRRQRPPQTRSCVNT